MARVTQSGLFCEYDRSTTNIVVYRGDKPVATIQRARVYSSADLPGFSAYLLNGQQVGNGFTFPRQAVIAIADKLSKGA